MQIHKIWFSKIQIWVPEKFMNLWLSHIFITQQRGCVFVNLDRKIQVKRWLTLIFPKVSPQFFHLHFLCPRQYGTYVSSCRKKNRTDLVWNFLENFVKTNKYFCSNILLFWRYNVTQCMVGKFDCNATLEGQKLKC